MRRKQKIRKQIVDWRLTLQEIGQGLRNAYPAPENLPPELSSMLTLHRQIELTKQTITEAQSESRKLVARIQEVLA